MTSGLPLSSDLTLEDRLTEIVGTFPSEFELNDVSIEDKVELLSKLETFVMDLPVIQEDGEAYDSPMKDAIRLGWLTGKPIAELKKHDGAESITRDLYGFKLPWILNGIAKKLRNIELFDHAFLIEEIAVLLEAGLPSMTKVKVYQAGIRSRSAANEIGNLFDDDPWERSIRSYKSDLIIHKDYYKSQVSEISGEWIEILSLASRKPEFTVKVVPNFTFGNIHEKTNTLLPKLIQGVQYLVSPDLKVIERLEPNAINYSEVNNVPGVSFDYDSIDECWKMICKNPHVRIEDEEEF